MDIRKLMEGVTPGPWSYAPLKGFRKFSVLGPDRHGWNGCRQSVCHVGVSYARNREANARAIAALPDLAQHAMRLEERDELVREKLFILSDRLRASGALDNDAVHDAYEAVVAALSNQIHQGDGEANNLPIEGSPMNEGTKR